MAQQEFSPRNGDLLDLRDAHLEDAFMPAGVLSEVAYSVVEDDSIELSPEDMCDVIMPPKPADAPYKARWELIEGAAEALKAAASNNSDDILSLATTLDMLKTPGLQEEGLRILPSRAVWLVEGGANRTSVVRREVANRMMLEEYGEAGAFANHPLYQFGSDLPIPRLRNGVENPGYKVAAEIAPDFLPEDDSLTEFGLNLASAQQAGYEVTEQLSQLAPSIANQIIVLEKAGKPKLVLIEPSKVDGGLKDAFYCLNRLVPGNLSRAQFVIATNGQYRPKDELQAENWAIGQDIDMLQPVAIGDEAGFSVEHNGKILTTAERSPTAYVNEMVILRRLSSR